MEMVMHITNVTLTEDYEDLYNDIWEAMDCDNATTINMEVKFLKFFVHEDHLINF